MKVCTKCKISKSLEEFNTRSGMLLVEQCKSCRNIYRRNLYELRRVKETSKHLTNNGSVVDGKKICSSCYNNLDISKFGKCNITKSGLNSNCRDCKTLMGYIADQKIKQEMVDAYGGGCSCCGETHIEFLTVEHILGDGKQHRQEVNGHGIKVYKDLKKKGWPKDKYTVMCWNCNCARKYDRPCPHNTKEYEEYKKWLIDIEFHFMNRNVI